VTDPVNHPAHYTSSKAKCAGCGRTIECIDITKHMNFSLGNAFKYIWRNAWGIIKGNTIEDLEKAANYIQIEIARLKEEG
jgi:polyferredoxin